MTSDKHLVETLADFSSSVKLILRSVSDHPYSITSSARASREEGRWCVMAHYEEPSLRCGGGDSSRGVAVAEGNALSLSGERPQKSGTSRNAQWAYLTTP